MTLCSNYETSIWAPDPIPFMSSNLHMVNKQKLLEVGLSPFDVIMMNLCNNSETSIQAQVQFLCSNWHIVNKWNF